MPIVVKPCAIEGLYEIQPKVFGDHRGFFFECYSKKDMAAAGLTMDFIQDNQSYSKKGTLRGLHFQRTYPQGKLVRAIAGQVYDVAVDLRPGSKTFGQHHSVLLSSELQNQFYIPPGFAHGFMVVSDEAVFAYKCTDYYHPEDEGGLMWNDPTLGIAWPSSEVILSAKDQNFAPFDPNTRYFKVAI